MDKISGTVVRVSYYNPENGYSVLKFEVDPKTGEANLEKELVTLVGQLPELNVGDYLLVSGSWVVHPRHGRQFEVKMLQPAVPENIEGLQKFLGSGLLKGIGPKLAQRMLDQFGLDIIKVIETEPEKLLQVKDIGRKRLKEILLAWSDQKQIKEIMIFLYSHGITSNLALKIQERYGEEAIAVVQQDPYQLARDLHGVGFKTSDRIARSLGLPKTHPSRVEAGLVYILEEASRQGHVYLAASVLIAETSALLNLEPALLEAGILSLQGAELICVDMLTRQTADSLEVVEAIYLPPYFYCEKGIAKKLTTLKNTNTSKLADIPETLFQLESNLTIEQAGAVKMCLRSPVSILTGGPGTGKTTTLRALIQIAESAGKRVALASPTGRAAKRLSEACGRSASTLHRLLEFSPVQGFTYHEENPLKIDLLVIDEASMLDILLTHSLLQAIEPGTHLLFVGDVDQLPSVGAGDVLREMILSGQFAITRLKQIFRQSEGSEIILNAHRVNQGHLPVFDTNGQDFFKFPANSPEQAADWVEDLVLHRIPQKFDFSPEDIQVLVPMYRGPAGIDAINQRLQAALNPASPLKPELPVPNGLLRRGDRVMQTVNNYDKQVFNGDIGKIIEVSSEDRMLTIDFDQRDVEYKFSELDQLVLAYAISVHKSQGSEFPVIILPLLTQHYLMLQRNLLYTAMTRAGRLCVLISNPKALAIAVKNNQVAQRNTFLCGRLQALSEVS